MTEAPCGAYPERMKTLSNIKRRRGAKQPAKPADRQRRSTGAAPTDVANLAEVFNALSNPTRLRIMLALRPREGAAQPERCVSEIAEIVQASESMTSHQLRLLRRVGLVDSRRAGKLMFYRMAEGPLDHLLGDGLAYVAR